MKQFKRALAGLVLAAALLTGSVFAAVPAAPEGSCVPEIGRASCRERV